MKTNMNARALGTINPHTVHPMDGIVIRRTPGKGNANVLHLDLTPIDVSLYPPTAIVHVSVQDSRSILSDRRDVGEIGAINLRDVVMPVSRQLWQSALDVRIAIVDPDTHRYLGKTNGTPIAAPNAGNGGSGAEGSAASPVVAKVFSEQILPVVAVIDVDGPVIGLSLDSPVTIADIRKNEGVVVCALPMAFQVFIRALVEDVDGFLSTLRWDALRKHIAITSGFGTWDELISSHSQGSTDEISRAITDIWYRNSKLKDEVKLIAVGQTSTDTNSQDDE